MTGSSRGPELRLVAAVLLAAAGLLSGCGPEQIAASNRCVPGRVVSCTCGGSETGLRRCGDDGRFGACSCSGRGSDASSDSDTDTGLEPVRCPSAHTVSGEEIFVGPNGSENADGTRDDPLDVETAVGRAGPGDAVVFLPGIYTETVKPEQSGTEDEPIVFRSAKPGEAVYRWGDGAGNDVAFYLDRVDHFRIEGFKLSTNGPRWVYLKGADDVILKDLVMEDHASVGIGLNVENGDDIALLDSVVRDSNKYVMADFENVSGLKLAGNVFGITDRGEIGVDGSTRIVVRGNVFRNPAGRGFVLEPKNRMLVENNLISQSIDGPGVKHPRSRLGGTNVIFRFNRFFWNWSRSLAVSNNSGATEDVYLYHNVFDRTRRTIDSHGLGLLTRRYGSSESGGTYRRVVVRNNLFTRLESASGEGSAVWSRNPGNPDLLFVGTNGFGTGSDGDAELRVDFDQPKTIAEIEKAYESFSGNIAGAAEYQSPERADHSLGRKSAFVDRAAPLTQTTSSGSGREVPVESAEYFTDGWNVRGLEGDVVAVGDSGQRARVEDVDYDRDVLEFEQGTDLDWQKGAPVSVPWSGTAGDIGMYERGSQGRPTVRIRQSAFTSSVGESVTFELVARGGVEPESVRWQIGDRVTECGTRTVSHEFSESGSYPVRLFVRDESGVVHRATGLVLATTPGGPLPGRDYNRQQIDQFVCDGNFRNSNGNADSSLTEVEFDPKEGYRCTTP